LKGPKDRPRASTSRWSVLTRRENAFKRWTLASSSVWGSNAEERLVSGARHRRKKTAKNGGRREKGGREGRDWETGFSAITQENSRR